MRAWMKRGSTGRGWALPDGAEVALWATVVSTFVAGAAVGVAVAPSVADRFGR